MLITRKDREKEGESERNRGILEREDRESTFGVYLKAIIRLHLAKLT